MLIPQVTQALSISASMVFNFLALVYMLNFCSMAVSRASPSFESPSNYFAAHARAACLRTSTASTGTATTRGLWPCLRALVRLVSIAASTPAGSLETEVVVDACCGESCHSWRGVAIRTFSHAAVNNPGLTGVDGRDCPFLFEFVSCSTGAGLAPLASRSCWSNVF